jgi:Asp/Glu/hydantoin racemase
LKPFIGVLCWEEDSVTGKLVGTNWNPRTFARAKKLVEENPDVGAIVLECTDLPPFAETLRSAAGVPIFDIVTLMNMVYQAVYTEPRSHKIKEG